MLILIKFILTTAFLTWVITLSNAFKPIREYITIKKNHSYLYKKYFFHTIFSFIEKLFECFACTGFWVSALGYYIVFWNINKDVFHFMCIGAISSLLILTIYQNKIQR